MKHKRTLIISSIILIAFFVAREMGIVSLSFGSGKFTSNTSTTTTKITEANSVCPELSYSEKIEYPIAEFTDYIPFYKSRTLQVNHSITGNKCSYKIDGTFEYSYTGSISAREFRMNIYDYINRKVESDIKQFNDKNLPNK